jgi:hypothetical protein
MAPGIVGSWNYFLCDNTHSESSARNVCSVDGFAIDYVYQRGPNVYAATAAATFSLIFAARHLLADGANMTDRALLGELSRRLGGSAF